MKRIIALCLLLALVFTFVSCNKEDNPPTDTEGGNGGNNIGNTIGGGGGGGSSDSGCSHNRDYNNDWVCDDCGKDLSKSGYTDENGTIHLPPTDI